MDEVKEVNTSQQQEETPNVVEKESDVKTKSTDVTKYEGTSNINALNLFNSVDLAAAEAFLLKVSRSDKGGFKSVNEGLAVLMRAKDLNLPFSTCIEHIHVINGKTGIDIHIVKALLSRAGCTWSKVKDYQPLYEYTDGINVYVDGSFPDYVERCKNKAEADAKVEADKDGETQYVYPVKFYKDSAGNIYRDYQLQSAPSKFGIALNAVQIAEITKSGKVAVIRIPNTPIDYVTEYVITRNLNGKEVTASGRFSYSDAVTANMFLKDTYKLYPKVLIGHRAFTYAAREIASDILFGVMETTELKIVSNVNLNNKDIDDVEDADVIDIQ